MSITVEWDRIERGILRAIESAVGNEAIRTADDAKRMAPVRKVFDARMLAELQRKAGQRPGRTRSYSVPLTSTQLRSELSIRHQLGLGPKTKVINKHRSPDITRAEQLNYRSTVRRSQAGNLFMGRARDEMDLKRRGDLRKLDIFDDRLDDHRLRSLLTARGRYELKSKRAISEGAEHGASSAHPGGTRRLGGRLRSEIMYTSATYTGKGYSATVESPTPYAKYVEFGTAHAAAQPFLRPAANIARQRFRQAIIKELQGIHRTTKGRRPGR